MSVALEKIKSPIYILLLYYSPLCFIILSSVVLYIIFKLNSLSAIFIPNFPFVSHITSIMTLTDFRSLQLNCLTTATFGVIQLFKFLHMNHKYSAQNN